MSDDESDKYDGNDKYDRNDGGEREKVNFFLLFSVNFDVSLIRR